MTVKKDIKNAKQFPRVFYARHMESGLAKYEDETILVSVDAIKNMMPSFEGKPLYVHHVDYVDLENIQETAHGFVTETFYNELDGWVWSKFLATDDIAFNAIASGWSVSNAYIPTEWGKGGTHHNCEYDREILNGEYSHLAIVPNPRYEDACIMSADEYKNYCEAKKTQLNELQNSKKESNIMKLFKREKKEVSVVDGDTLIEIKNDDGTVSEVLVQDMIESIKNAKKNEEEEKEKVNMDSEVDVDGETMTVEELTNRYSKLSNKKNEDDSEKANEEDDEKANEEDEEKSNEDDAEKENEAESKDEKSNSKDHFSDLKNARNVDLLANSTPNLRIDRLALGKSKY